MQPYQKQFLQLAISSNALRFGQFTLKSGRVSPYFFNAGQFNTGAALAELSRCYAAAIRASGIAYDVLFGPAYKGIPLAAATACALAEHHQTNTPFAYNRKEVKDHGEGGSLVGAPLKGRILIIDDVITAGTAIREVTSLIQTAGAEPAGVVIGLDRQERGSGNLSAVEEVQRDLNVPVISIATLGNLVEFLQDQKDRYNDLVAIERYREQFGIHQ